MCLSESFAKMGRPDLPISCWNSFSFKCLDGLMEVFLSLRLVWEVLFYLVNIPWLKVYLTTDEKAWTYWWGLQSN